MKTYGYFTMGVVKDDVLRISKLRSWLLLELSSSAILLNAFRGQFGRGDALGDPACGEYCVPAAHYDLCFPLARPPLFRREFGCPLGRLSHLQFFLAAAFFSCRFYDWSSSLATESPYPSMSPRLFSILSSIAWLITGSLGLSVSLEYRA